jgi:hypothetical protein
VWRGAVRRDECGSFGLPPSVIVTVSPSFCAVFRIEYGAYTKPKGLEGIFHVPLGKLSLRVETSIDRVKGLVVPVGSIHLVSDSF